MTRAENIKKEFKITYNGEDITDFVVENFFFQNATSEKITSAYFIVDTDIGFDIKIGGEILLLVRYEYSDSFIKQWGGIVTNPTKNEARFYTIVNCKGYGWLPYQTEYSGIFRADTGKANPKTIFIDVVSEKFSDWTWDSDSFPDVDSSLNYTAYKKYQNSKVGDIFDEISSYLDRDWWVDENKKLYCKVREFSEVTNKIEFGKNIIGEPSITSDDSRFANICKVYGAKIERQFQQSFSGNGTAQQIELTYLPGAIDNVQYLDGTRVSVTQEGIENFNDSSEYDAYVKIGTPSYLIFNSSTLSQTCYINYKIVDQVYEQFESGGSVEELGWEKIKRIENPEISTNDEAFEIARNYIEKNSVIPQVIETQVEITNQTQLSEFKAGKKIQVVINNLNEYLNCVESRWEGSVSSGVNLTLQFTDKIYSADDVLIEFLKKIRQKEEQERKNNTITVKYFYWGGTIKVDMTHLRIYTQQIDSDSFRMVNKISSETDKRGILGKGFFLKTDPFSDNQQTLIAAHNSDNVFEDFLYDTYKTDTDETTATVDTNNNKIVFTTGQVWQTKVIVYENKYVQGFTPLFEYTGNLLFEVSADNGVTFLPATNGVEVLFTFATGTPVWGSGGLSWPISWGALTAATGQQVIIKITEQGSGSAQITKVKGRYRFLE